MTGLKIEGVVFDVDGVLFDTERLTQQTWLAVSREMGWPQVGEAYLEFVGQNRADIFQKMEDLFGAEFPKDAFMAACSARSQARMETEGVPMKPGVGEVLELLRSRGVPTALATSTGRPRTERRMEMTGLGPCFSAIITGDQVAHSKPDPEIYLMACRALGTTPERTVAVEDSRNGILSASRAGMRVAMVPDLLPPTPELEPLLASTPCSSCGTVWQRSWTEPKRYAWTSEIRRSRRFFLISGLRKSPGPLLTAGPVPAETAVPLPAWSPRTAGW